MGRRGWGFLGVSSIGGDGGWGHQLGLYGLQDQALQLHSNSHPLCLCQCTTIKEDGNWIDEIRGEGMREEDVNY